MTEEKTVHYWRANQDEPMIQGDLIEVAITQVRDWDESKRTFSPSWMVQVDPEPYEGHPNGEWKSMTESDSRFAKYKAKDAQMFPNETITLVLMDKEDKEIRWELKNLGYESRGKTHVKAIDRALAEAAGRDEDHFVKFKRMDRRAAEIGNDLGGCNLIISTPDFKMKGDNEEILKQLIKGQWIAPMDDEQLKAAAERGFISRPYRIVNAGVGTHDFRGVTSWVQVADAEESGTSDKSSTEGANKLFDEDVPF